MMEQNGVDFTSSKRQITRYEDQLFEIRKRIFTFLIPALMVAVCLSIIVMNSISGAPSTPAMMLWFGLVSVLGICYTFRYRAFRGAVFIFFAGTTICISIAIHSLNIVLLLYIYSFLVLVAMFLLYRSEAVVFAILSSILITSLTDLSESLAEILVPLLFIWIAVIIGSIVMDGIFQIVDMLETHQRYILQQMNEAREGRAILAQRTKALDEASQNLRYANSQLRQARQAAEEARRLKAQFAANVSHELRTPINLIVGFTEMIVNAPDTYGTALPSAYWTDVNTIYRNARHLQSMINDVLDVSQIEASQMAVVKEEISLALVITEAVDMLRDQIIRKGLTFLLDMPDNLPTLWLDRVRIRQVIINLIGNALRFTDKGSISLSIQLEQDKVLICISDTGIGIPEQEMSRIFEEFHQLDSSLSRRYGGSGLGLTLSKHFVELHDGNLYAKSKGVLGKGSQFYIELPLMERSIQYKTTYPTTSTNRQQEHCFVVLDNDPVIIQLFERYSTKHKALGSTYSEQTVQWLKTIQPSAVVMDSEMAKNIEAETLSEMRYITPIITCPMPSGRRMMQKLGVTDYLVKPVTAAALAQTIQEVSLTVRSILIIDDDREIVRLFDRMLRSMNKDYIIRKAYGGLEGLALMRSQIPDVVILDLLMPNVDGFAVIHHMKTSEALTDIPIVMVSARGASEAVTPISNGTLSVYKHEGFQPLELIRCVESLVDNLNLASSTES